MIQNLVLSGVGGQGILTIAHVISSAALKQNMKIKQSEVHGMSQRGGGVQSHLRISDEEIYSDLIPTGEADLIISVEPLESLRYVQFLHKEKGGIVASVNPYTNIENYPEMDGILERITRYPKNVLLDANKVARAAGSARAVNIAILGASAPYLTLEDDALEEATAELFARKGEKIVDINRKAFRYGRNVSVAYRDAIEQGASPEKALAWIESLIPDFLDDPNHPDAPKLEK